MVAPRPSRTPCRRKTEPAVSPGDFFLARRLLRALKEILIQPYTDKRIELEYVLCIAKDTKGLKKR